MSIPLNAKQRVANHAANLIEDDMVVGLGTGSTANYFIEALAERQQQGLKCVTVASSIVSTIKAKALGLPQMSIEQLSHLDVYVDGADEVTPDKVLLGPSKTIKDTLIFKALKARVQPSLFISRQPEMSLRYPIPITRLKNSWAMVNLFW